MLDLIIDLAFGMLGCFFIGIAGCLSLILLIPALIIQMLIKGDPDDR
jgi:hypothetical protein